MDNNNMTEMDNLNPNSGNFSKLQELDERIKELKKINEPVPGEETTWSIMELSNHIPEGFENYFIKYYQADANWESNFVSKCTMIINEYLELIKNTFRGVDHQLFKINDAPGIFRTYESLVGYIEKNYTKGSILNMFGKWSTNIASTHQGYQIMKNFVSELIKSKNDLNSKREKLNKQKEKESSMLRLVHSWGTNPNQKCRYKKFKDLLEKHCNVPQKTIDEIKKELKIKIPNSIRKIGSMMFVAKAKMGDWSNDRLISQYVANLKMYGKNTSLTSLLKENVSYDAIVSWLAMHCKDKISTKDLETLCSKREALKFAFNKLKSELNKNEYNIALPVHKWMDRLNLSSQGVFICKAIQQAYKKLGGVVAPLSENLLTDTQPPLSDPKLSFDNQSMSPFSFGTSGIPMAGGPQLKPAKLPVYKKGCVEKDLIKNIRELYNQSQCFHNEYGILRVFLDDEEIRYFVLFFYLQSLDLKKKELDSTIKQLKEQQCNVDEYMIWLRKRFAIGKKNKDKDKATNIKSKIQKEIEENNKKEYQKSQDTMKEVNRICDRITKVIKYYNQMKRAYRVTKTKDEDSIEQTTIRQIDVNSDEGFDELFGKTIAKHNDNISKQGRAKKTTNENENKNIFAGINIREIKKLFEEVKNNFKDI